MLSNIIFVILIIVAFGMFAFNLRKIIRNIKLGKALNLNYKHKSRIKLLLQIAFGQSKTLRNPLVGVLHFIIYTGFIIVNIEMIEILSDGIFGTHHLLAFMGSFYTFLISVLEIFAVTVIIVAVIFLARRNILKIKRFHNKEMTSWPRLDANIILIFEILLMSAFLLLNSADSVLQGRDIAHYVNIDNMPVSHLITPLLDGLSNASLIFIERFCWWFHIIGILIFMNYVLFSKHLHIFFAFPNVYYSKLVPKAALNNMESVRKEVDIMLGKSEAPENEEEPDTFGAKDVLDLTWKNLLDAYSCTECGRCTAVCPAHLTGKKLSPRKVVMDVRDRLEDVGKQISKNKDKALSEDTLIHSYISSEELWACTTCNACTQECPVNIDHPAIITELRRFIFLEESAAPSLINAMSVNIENNGAPWKYSAADRFNWADKLYFNDENKTKIEVPLMADRHAENKAPEYLFWVGSAGCYDAGGIEISRNFVKILQHTNIDYAVLGTEETDSGDNAKRAGNEFLFQMQALTNIELMNEYGVKKIITCDPHDYNTLKNEYSGLGGNYEVIHHSQLISQLIEEGKINIKDNKFNNKTITFHDPCYLGRGNGEYEAPRNVLNQLQCNLVEMKNCKSRSLCCGAGGTQMFKEAEKGDKEIYELRTEHALEVKADIIATACPMCLTMMTDGIKMKNKENEIQISDISELIVKSLGI